MNDIEDKIIARCYITGVLKLTSPLIIGSGETEFSDYDVVRDGDGDIYLPGTSIAGVLRSYLRGKFIHLRGELPIDLVQAIFGEYETEKKSRESKPTFQSLLTCYDAVLPSKEDDIKKTEEINEFEISVRDGVKLSCLTKVALEGKKFDYEIVEPGIKLSFKMRLLLYEKHRNDKQEDLIKETLYILLKALKEGDLRFGAKATRGFGKVQLQEEKILWLDMSNPDHVDQWIDFEWKGGWGANCSLDELNQKRLIFDKDWFDIQVKFRIPYSLLIRTYNAEPGEADMVHITTKIDSQEIPIIPGPSWAGALQHAIYHTTLDLRSDNYDSHSIQGALLEIENGLFGEVPETDQSQAHKSRVIIDESLIYHTTLLPYTRIKVDRFSGEVVQGSLFSEEVANQGEVELDLVIKEFQDYEIGLILLAILELWYGLQPIGGTTSIGRGILKGCYIQIEENGFKVDDPLKSNECWTEINQYLKALADHIKNELGGS